MTDVAKAFKQVGPIEYEIVINGKTKTIRVPFAVTEQIFHSFINSGGIIDPVTGAVQQDILQLISSFRESGDILLTERDEEGHLVREGNCGTLSAPDVIALFQLATEIIEVFMKALTQMQSPQSQPESSAGTKSRTGKAKG